MAAKSWCLFITESAFKSPVSVASNTVNSAWCPLDLPDDDAVGIERTPNVEELATAKSLGEPDRVVGDTYGVEGPARGILYPEQAPLLVGWGCGVVDQSATPDFPWTTTEPDGRDLASATFAHFYEDWAFNSAKRRFRGCKARSFTVEAARGTRGGVVQWSADVVGADEASSSDTEPTLAQYPTLAPYHLSDCALTVNNVAITNFESFRLQVTNTLHVAHDEGQTASVIRLQARRMVLSVTAALKQTPDWRALFTGQTLLATTSLVLTHPGNNHRITFSGQAACRLASWSKNLRLQDRPNQTIEIVPMHDRSTGKNFTVAFSDPTP